jgi:hypothetical protein
MCSPHDAIFHLEGIPKKRMLIGLVGGTSMSYTPKQTVAIITFVVLIILYCTPTLLLGWYLYKIDGAALDFDGIIPQMVVTFNSGNGGPDNGGTPDLLSMFHRVLLPVSTFIAGLISVSVSRSRLTYYLMGLILLLIILVFLTYLWAGPSLADADQSMAKQVTAIGSLLSRTFDTLFSYILLFLGLSVAKENVGPNASTPTADMAPENAQVSK